MHGAELPMALLAAASMTDQANTNSGGAPWPFLPQAP